MENLLVRSAANISSLAMGCWHLDGRIFDANEALVRLLACTRDDLEQGRVRWPDITPGEYSGRDDRALEQMREFGEIVPYEKEYVCNDGKRIPVLVGGCVFGDRKCDSGPFFAINLSGSRSQNCEGDRDYRKATDVLGQQLYSVDNRLTSLTVRERQIAELLAQGETSKRIARQLAISPKTVDNHRATILRKLGLDNATQLAVTLLSRTP